MKNMFAENLYNEAINNGGYAQSTIQSGHRKLDNWGGTSTWFTTWGVYVSKNYQLWVRSREESVNEHSQRFYFEGEKVDLFLYKTPFQDEKKPLKQYKGTVHQNFEKLPKEIQELIHATTPPTN